MKECKCGRIPPCYGGKKFRIHEELEKMPRVAPLSEETAQEMIKTLEDFSKPLEAEIKACELINLICEDIQKSIKSNDMEEKKTKKMTKAEAFEWLKCKKVDASIDECGIQSKLFSLGVVWCTLTTNPCSSVKYLLIDKECHMSHCGSDLDYYKSHCYEEISAEDILSIEIVEEEKVLSVDCALEHAKWIMKYLREECSPHTKMIIEGDHAELVEGVKSVVWKE